MSVRVLAGLGVNCRSTDQRTIAANTDNRYPPCGRDIFRRRFGAVFVLETAEAVKAIYTLLQGLLHSLNIAVRRSSIPV